MLESNMSIPNEAIKDMVIIGGGVNGCGIARDAAGRGLSVCLVEKNDLASATSSASTKLFHGGLRYLEYYKFRLVKEALIEREVLLKAMPHISWPLRFVLPIDFSQRPAWFIRLGLFIYDHLGGRKILPPTSSLKLATEPEGQALKACYRKAFEYSDCWVQDSRLVVLNAKDAAGFGADIKVQTEVVRAQTIVHPEYGSLWEISLKTTGSKDVINKIYARILVNAAGAHVSQVLHEVANSQSKEGVRLVRGSHIVVKKFVEHDKAYILQGKDGRFVFTIPFEEDFTLIGTTDQDHVLDTDKVECSQQERDYLCNFVNEYFTKSLTKDDVVWSFSGVRSLYDDGASSATDATRDYVLSLNQEHDAPLLNIFGGKITTYRRLAQVAIQKIASSTLLAKQPELIEKLSKKSDWTEYAQLPGGEFELTDTHKLLTKAEVDFPFFSAKQIRRLFRCYGTELWDMLGQAQTLADLGVYFGAGLSETEVRWLIKEEFAQSLDDIIWRRTKLGLLLSEQQKETLRNWLANQS